MVVAVRLTIIFPTLKNNMNLTTGIGIMRGVEVEVIHLHYSLPHDRRHIPNPVMNNVMWHMEVQPGYFQLLCAAPWMCLQNWTAKQSAVEQEIASTSSALLSVSDQGMCTIPILATMKMFQNTTVF